MIRFTIRLLSSAFFLASHFCLGQFTDNFSDNDFTNNPTWIGTPDFIINASSQLQLNNTVAGTSRLSSSVAIPSLDNFEWQAYIKQTFASSGSNYGRVYLVSNQTNLSGPVNGYYLQFGEAGSSDAIELFRQTGLVSTSVCRATNGSIANSFTVRVRVLRNNSGLWKLLVDYSGGSNFVLEASGTDATYNASSAIGVLCVYTASNANKFFYDDFFMGPEVVDSSPPTIVSVTPVTQTQLDIAFNEKVESVSSQTASNYFVNRNIGSPSSAILQADNKTVRLTFAQAFPNALTCQLSVSGVKDLFSNAMTLTNNNFLFFQPVPAEANDLILTEIFADPSPSVGLPELEFIEIYNRSNKIFDLQNWKITDGSSLGSLPSHLFFPNEYIILTSVSSASQFSVYGTVLGVSNFPTLNNSGDQLSLKDNNGVEINKVSYTIDWYRDDDKKQGGYTLELIDPADRCGIESNWVASTSANGGTPGIQNSVFANNADLAGPKLISVTPTSATELVVQFDEKLRAQLPASNDFTIHPESVVSQVMFTDETLRVLKLTLSTNLELKVLYSISAKNIYDCPGNMIEPDNNFVFGLPDVTTPFDVVINEIFPNPSPSVGMPAFEFVEIYNRSDKIFDLKNWKITDGSSIGTLPQHQLFPNEFVILTSTIAAAQFSSFGTVLGVPNFPTLNNSGETLVLKDQLEIEVNKVAFTDDWYRDDAKQEGGYSLERIDPANICANESNWAASEAATGGTPGIQNSIFANKPDLTAPKLISAIPTSATEITVEFDEKLQEQLPATTDFMITPSIVVSSVEFKDESLRTFLLTLNSNLESGVTYTIITQNIYDCPGNVIGESNSFVFGLPEQADSLDLLVNEILFNPRPTGNDFVEVYNNTGKYINLKNWSIANVENGEVSNTNHITDADFLLPPNRYIVFTEDVDVIKGEYVLAMEENLFKVKNLPSFNDDEGTVVLMDSLHHIIDLLTYSDDYHSVFIDDDEGVSLERISFSDPTNEPANWKSSSSMVGFATPGFVNSNVSGEHGEGQIVVSPEIFDPINGQPDFTQIHYSFEQGGSVANVRILDSQGREIKQIVSNAILGTQGFFRWDGDTKEGTKARTGYYIVWVEIFDSSGSLKTYRERVVIGNSSH